MSIRKACTVTVSALAGMGLLIGAAQVMAASGNASGQSSQAVNAKAAKKIINSSNCSSCHAADHKIVGPSFQSIAKRYAPGGPKVVDRLAKHVKNGVNGIWSNTPMPPHPNLAMAKIKTVVRWILAQTPSSSSASAQSAQQKKQYTYKVNGKQVTLNFPVFRSSKHKYVTHSLFKGYELYNSYCFRCHGPDAVGGEYAPDLRHAITQGGVSEKQFISIAMEGRKAKGMPSWAGFFSEKQIKQIFDYVKARAVGLVSTGRPSTPQG
ncbi:MAG TPA: c-type cytochrome [Gammaproteobacteria bacterium]|nr:c-type cytochrome [Gammaproteobacteria bacterium]